MAECDGCFNEISECLGYGSCVPRLRVENASLRTQLEAQAGRVKAEREIIDKAVGSMNLAAAYLWKAAESIGASHPSDPCVYYAQRLQIAAGALQRMLAMTPPPEKEKPSQEKAKP